MPKHVDPVVKEGAVPLMLEYWAVYRSKSKPRAAVHIKLASRGRRCGGGCQARSGCWCSGWTHECGMF